MFYLKRIKPIKLRLYTGNPSAFEYFKPDYAGNFRPKWMSDASDKTKHCYGLKTTFKDGFCVPIWSDLKITTERSHDGEYTGNFEFADTTSVVRLETRSPNMNPKSKMCFKLLSPWLVECDEDVHFVMMENMWTNLNRGAEFLSGTMEFKYQHGTHMFFYINRAPQTFMLYAEDVPVVFKQLSERKLEIETSYDPEKATYLLGKGNTISFSQDHMKRRNIARNKHGHT